MNKLIPHHENDPDLMRARKNKHMKCLECNKPFQLKSKYNPNQKYCSVKCSLKFNNRKWGKDNKAYNVQRVLAWKKANPLKHEQQLERYYLNHTKEIKVRVKAWGKRNPEKVKASKKRWEQKNPLYRKEYYGKNKERIIEQIIAWQQRNSDKTKEYGKDYREKNREKINEKGRKYYWKNRNKILQQHKEKAEQDRSNKIKNTEIHKDST